MRLAMVLASNFCLNWLMNSLDGFPFSGKSGGMLMLSKLIEVRIEGIVINRYLNTWDLKSWLCIYFCGVCKAHTAYFFTAPTISCQCTKVQPAEEFPVWLRGNEPTRIHEGVGSIPGLAHCVKVLALLWLGYRLAATAPIRPRVWELPYAVVASLKKQTNTQKSPISRVLFLWASEISSQIALLLPVGDIWSFVVIFLK